MKPATRVGYTELVTAECERTLVSLLRGLGPWKEAIYLIGGLTPRYLVRATPPDRVEAHAGTLDIDVVVNLEILVGTDAYRRLEDNLAHLGFERATNREGEPVSWRWQTVTDRRVPITLELLTDHPGGVGGKVRGLPVAGRISALHIPRSSIVYDLYAETEVRATLPDDRGITAVTVRHANLVSFTCLKAFAFEDRAEPKDAYDLVYCIEHAPGGLAQATRPFQTALRHPRHGDTVGDVLEILRHRFADDAEVAGHQKEGPATVATFELGQGPEEAEARALRRRQVSDLVQDLLRRLSG
ncbi:MAG: antitoxin [Gammaproteobacteria bacterium]|nr:antitoxin [Gammaproteobacteria bacterium]